MIFMKNATALTVEERASKLVTKANKALFAGIARDWAAIEKAANEIGNLTVKAVNLSRACGEKLKQLCDHEQLSLAFFLKVQPHLPKKMDYTKVKSMVCMANLLTEDVKTPQEAFSVSRKMMQAVMEFTEPKRLAEQSAHDSNPWSELVSRGSSVIALISDMEPLEKWGHDKRRSFLSTYKPLVDTYKAVEALDK